MTFLFQLILWDMNQLKQLEFIYEKHQVNNNKLQTKQLLGNKKTAFIYAVKIKAVISFINYYENKNIVFLYLKDLCSIIKAGGDKPYDTKKEYITNSIPVIANGIENNGIVGYSFEKNKSFIDCITLSARGTIGFPTIRNYCFIPIVRLIVLKPYKSIDLKYLCLALESKIIKGVGTSIKQLTIPMLENLVIEMSSIDYQRKVVSKIQKINNFIQFINNFGLFI